METRFVLYFVVPLALIAIITIAGLVLLSISFRTHQKTGLIEIRDWPSTGGKVLAVRLEPRQGKQPSAESFDPIVEYAYFTNGEEKRGNKVFAGENEAFSREAAQEIINKYPLNSYVAVRFNPQNSNESALEPQIQHLSAITTAGWILSGFGLTACCFTSLMAIIILGAIQ